MKKETRAKIILFSIISLILVSVLTNFILAQTANPNAEAVVSGAQQTGRDVVDWIRGFLSPFFEETVIGTRALLGLLLFLIVLNIMPWIMDDTTPTGRFIVVVVSIVIAILGIITIPPNFLEAIALHYGIMGTTLLSILPLLIILITTVRIKNLLAARAIWLLYTVYYFALYIYVAFGLRSQGTSLFSPEVIPYLIAIVIGIVLFIFIIPIRRLVFLGEMSAYEEMGKEVSEEAAFLYRQRAREIGALKAKRIK